MISCQHGHLEIAEVLIKHGANINAISRGRRTPLILASEANSPPLVSLLLSHGADVSPSDVKGYTALSMACLLGHREVFEQLLASGADDNLLIPKTVFCEGRGLLFCASFQGHVEIVDRLILSGANVNDVNEGKTPLMMAIRGWKKDVMMRLVSGDLDVNIVGDSGQTSLLLACSREVPEFVSQLINKGANTNHSNDCGETPLTVAIAEKDVLKWPNSCSAPTLIPIFPTGLLVSPLSITLVRVETQSLFNFLFLMVL
jgi:ankyrin repeat protein